QHQKAAGLNNLQLVKRMGFKNFNKALRRFSHFTQTGYLPENHARKLSRVLDIDLAQLKTLESRHSERQWADLNLFIQHFDQIWAHRRIIIRHREYANIGFSGLYFSVAYLGTPPYNIGLLLQHYMQGDWLVDNVCCDRLYIIGAGGSPLSGINTCHGFCRRCRRHKSFRFASFGMLLKAHKAIKPACQQGPTDKTITDLLDDFK
ncbi:MAG: hypothetical protein DWP95_12555, partial [Proteobacteria bacterium]